MHMGLVCSFIRGKTTLSEKSNHQKKGIDSVSLTTSKICFCTFFFFFLNCFFFNKKTSIFLLWSDLAKGLQSNRTIKIGLRLCTYRSLVTALYLWLLDLVSIFQGHLQLLFFSLNLLFLGLDPFWYWQVEPSGAPKQVAWGHITYEIHGLFFSLNK